MELLTRTCRFEEMNIERIFARGFVVVGGLFWVAMLFGASFAYQGKSLASSLGTALIPLGVTVAAFAVGWFYELLASALLAVSALGVIGWGLAMHWETGVWLIVGTFIIAPIVIAALLFLLAARMQNVCELRDASGTAA